MKKLLTMVGILSCFYSVGMESAELGCIPEPHVVGFDIFLKNQHKRLSHKLICALAKVTRSWKKYLLDTAPERQEYLARTLGCYGDKSCPYYVNKYGSVVCETGSIGRVPPSKKVGNFFDMQGYFLNEGEMKMFDVEWNNFSGPVASLWRPFLNPQGDLCHYGWGKGDSRLWGMHTQLIQYCVMPNNKQEFFRCGIQVNSHGNYALSHYAALPNLLNAFLNCPVRVKDFFAHEMLFALKDAIIPDNYAEYQDSGERYLNRNFDGLPPILKDAIIKRYEECKKQGVKI